MPRVMNLAEVGRLRSTIGEGGVARLARLLKKGCEIWFVADLMMADTEPDLTPEERTFARNRLTRHSWTWVHRPRSQ